MARGIASVLAALVAWIVIATLGNFAMRATMPGYTEVEKAMTFTQPMLAARLIVGGLATIGAGLTVAWISRRNGIAAKALAIVLLAVFVPTHLMLWDRFPLWYHFTFFVSLVVLSLLGASLYRGNSAFTTKEVGNGD